MTFRTLTSADWRNALLRHRLGMAPNSVSAQIKVHLSRGAERCAEERAPTRFVVMAPRDIFSK